MLGISLDIRQAGALEEALARAVGTANVSAFPPCLIVLLQRFEVTSLTGKRDKICDFFTFPEVLDVGPFIGGPESLYELVSVQVHAGTSASGEFLAFIRPTATDWLQFHDTKVAPASRDQAVFQNFGRAGSNAFMIVYVQKSAIATVFKPVGMPQRIRDFISPVQVREHSRRERDSTSRIVRLFTDSDIREAILDGRELSEVEIPTEVPVEEDWTNRDIYMKVSALLARNVDRLRLWRVGQGNMPTASIPDNVQRFAKKDQTLFVQELPDPQLFIEKDMRLALVSFFFPHATPRVQYLGAVTVTCTHPISQLFPALWDILGIPRTLFNIYCEQLPDRPLSQAVPLAEIGITECASYIAEAIMVSPTPYQPGFRNPKPEKAITYYAMVRPGGDLTAGEYLERKRPQLQITLRRVGESDRPRATVAVPEGLPVTELPEFVLFATREKFDANQDTLQLFRRRVDSDLNEVMPYVLRNDTTVKVLFSADLRRGGDLVLFYDIIVGISPKQLESMVIRTCELFDSPTHCRERIRYPMRSEDPLAELVRHIQEEIWPCANARLLLSTDGCVRLISPDDPLPDETTILRFEEVPPDQSQLGPGEFLVVAMVCRASQGVENTVPVGTSFLFKVIPGEVMEVTRGRIARYEYADGKVIPWVSFQARRRLLNDDEILDAFIGPNEVLKIILPDKARANAIIRRSRKSTRASGVS
jgi:hypothetical protein